MQEEARFPSHRFQHCLIFQMYSKRVILTVSSSCFHEMGNTEIFACIKVLLVHTRRPATEIDEGKHYWHFYPAGPRERSTSYIIIDMDKDGYPASSHLPKEFPHELYNMKAEGEDK